MMNMIQDFGDLRIGGEASLETDILIIGSGAGGSTVAATAAELGLSVFIVEEGPYVPAAKAPARMADSFTKLWRHGGLTAAYGAPPVTYAEGRCVGGSTEINSAIFQRAPENLLSEWATRYKIRHFDAESLTPHYDWAAQIVNASLTSAPLGAPSDILAQAGRGMGWQVKELERGQRSCVGTNMCSLACPTGGKQSMTATLIPRLLANGTRLLAEAKVQKLLMKGRRILGAKVAARSADGQIHKVVIRAKTVFLCAGAIQTPALLQSAGFRGPVGQKLRLHPTIKCLALYDQIIDAQNSRLPLVAITEFMPNLRLGGSVFTPGTFGLALAEDWKHRSQFMGKMRHAAIYYAMVRGQGYGRIRTMPNGVAPLVTYKLDKQDWRGLTEGISRLGQALLQTGAKQVLPSVTGHRGWHQANEAAAEFDGALPHNRSQLMTIHLFGSCPMGEDESLCGVDSFGRVHGAENLYVADASLIPEAPGVNPQASVMALARRNTLHVLGGRL